MGVGVGRAGRSGPAGPRRAGGGGRGARAGRGERSERPPGCAGNGRGRPRSASLTPPRGAPSPASDARWMPRAARPRPAPPAPGGQVPGGEAEARRSPGPSRRCEGRLPRQVSGPALPAPPPASCAPLCASHPFLYELARLSGCH